MVSMEEFMDFFTYKNPFDFPINDLDKYMKGQYDGFEALLDADGVFYEAPNGHTEGLIQMAAKKLNMDRNELYNTCPPEYYCDMISWGIEISKGVIPVWSTFYQGNPTIQQKKALIQLEKKLGRKLHRII